MPPKFARKRAGTTNESASTKRNKPDDKPAGELKFPLPSTPKAPRAVSLSEFKGATYLNIREYYLSPTNEELPGKKGISLKVDQWRALLRAAPEIEAELKRRGEWLEYGSDEEKELEKRKKEVAEVKGVKATDKQEEEKKQNKKADKFKSKETIESEDEEDDEEEIAEEED
ncbi:hypothetical protein BJ508DRAFT_414669 [Ascobolus immersus RN42]|uniref:Transcriptional coactivator p15 (PC4) C-terminal domain-containing protein n=1 Tax=Ascobolus immersus RN42 TaxID=1160509 RepID=A0A3N4IA94_ASCIM|nr:hypothetical protein BJ508DRAFT_414669 [Ascobolus immersus RN42]